MRLTIISVGRGRGSEAATLCQDYLGRLPWPAVLCEVEERRPLPSARRRAAEAERLRRATPAGALRVALDETGRTLTSTQFARQLAAWSDRGIAELAFWIGGADGLDPDLRAEAALVLSLGRMTWPHLLVRVLLAEQLYRAGTILKGHPYHRG